MGLKFILSFEWFIVVQVKEDRSGLEEYSNMVVSNTKRRALISIPASNRYYPNVESFQTITGHS